MQCVVAHSLCRKRVTVFRRAELRAKILCELVSRAPWNIQNPSLEKQSNITPETTRCSSAELFVIKNSLVDMLINMSLYTV